MTSIASSFDNRYPSRFLLRLYCVSTSSSVCGYRHRVLKMCAPASIFRYRRPAVLQNLNPRLAGVHHRLDRDHHARFQLLALAPPSRSSEPAGLRADCVPIPWPTKSRTTLNPSASTVFCTAAPTSPSVAPAFTARIPLWQRLLRHLQQLPRLLVHPLPYRDRNCRIAVVPIHHHARIDRNNIPVAQLPFRRRNPVHHFVD